MANQQVTQLPQTPTGEDLEQLKIEKNRALAASCCLDPTIDYGEPKYVFSRKGVGFAPLGDIQMIKAPQKNGKTFLFALLMGAMLKGEYLGIKCEIEHPRLLYIDTEQHPRNTQLVYRRACRIANIDGRARHLDFQAYHFRGKQPEEIASSLFQLIDDFRPTVVFLDGTRDIINDFNDQQESAAMIRRLMDKALERDCSIWNIIHVNPGTDKARGHLGTEAQNKVSDAFLCLKEKTADGVIFTVQHTDTRNKDIEDWSFQIQDVPESENRFLAIPVQTHISIKSKTTANETMGRALTNDHLRYSDLVDRVMEVAQVKKTKAKELIGDAINSGIIVKDPVFGKYRYVGLDLPNEDEMPF